MWNIGISDRKFRTKMPKLTNDNCLFKKDQLGNGSSYPRRHYLFMLETSLYSRMCTTGSPSIVWWTRTAVSSTQHRSQGMLSCRFINRLASPVLYFNNTLMHLIRCWGARIIYLFLQTGLSNLKYSKLVSYFVMQPYPNLLIDFILKLVICFLLEKFCSFIIIPGYGIALIRFPTCFNVFVCCPCYDVIIIMG